MESDAKSDLEDGEDEATNERDRDPALGGDEDADPELVEFLREQRRRHHQLIAGVVAGSLVLTIAGGVCLWIAREETKIGYIAGGLLMTGLGVLGLLRSALSLFTDLDTRDHGDWDDLIGHGEDR